MNNQIFVDSNLIHPETNSDVVLHNNSNLKNFLNGLLSTDNMPTFMQNFLMSSDYIEANQALHTIPETFFDHAFNKWSAKNSPTVSGGCFVDGGSAYLASTPGWTIGDKDFTVSCRAKANSADKFVMFFAYSASHSGFIGLNCRDSTNPAFIQRNSTGATRANLQASMSCSLDTFYHFEIAYDASSKTRYLFVDGQLQASDSLTLVSYEKFMIGGTSLNTTYLDGYIDFIQISDCVRHTENFSPSRVNNAGKKIHDNCRAFSIHGENLHAIFQLVCNILYLPKVN